MASAGARIVMLAGECVPFAKVGGLADVLGALPRELEKLGYHVTIIIPKYGSIDLERFGFQRLSEFDSGSFEVYRSTLPGSSVPVFLVGNDHYFGRRGIYTDPETGWDFPDQADRWIHFQRSAMDFISASLGPVDVLHCHDHQAGLVPAYLERLYRSHPAFTSTGTVFTIHNMGYQGVFPGDTMSRTGFNTAEFFPLSPFEFYGMLNFMKVGAVFADSVTTVSETYAWEIQQGPEFGYGLEGVVRSRVEPPIGILNGIDYGVWNPATDPTLFANYSVADLTGKRINKEGLFRDLGLDLSRIDRPLLTMISRIDVQKGFDLVVAILDDLLSQEISFVLLGSGNKETERQLASVIDGHPGKAVFTSGYDDRLAHRIEAAADIFLMPSKYEPCGLNQMYSMRYGAVPVVRATGGLADTVREFNAETREGTGFRFLPYDSFHFSEAIARALRYWENAEQWRCIVSNGMQLDFSWARSATRYAEVYQSVQKRRQF